MYISKYKYFFSQISLSIYIHIFSDTSNVSQVTLHFVIFLCTRSILQRIGKSFYTFFDPLFTAKSIRMNSSSNEFRANARISANVKLLRAFSSSILAEIFENENFLSRSFPPLFTHKSSQSLTDRLFLKDPLCTSILLSV